MKTHILTILVNKDSQTSGASWTYIKLVEEKWYYEKHTTLPRSRLLWKLKLVFIALAQYGRVHQARLSGITAGC